MLYRKAANIRRYLASVVLCTQVLCCTVLRSPEVAVTLRLYRYAASREDVILWRPMLSI